MNGIVETSEIFIIRVKDTKYVDLCGFLRSAGLSRLMQRRILFPYRNEKRATLVSLLWLVNKFRIRSVA